MSPVSNSALDQPSMLPHQQQFIDRFFACPAEQGYIISSEPGLGSAIATMQIAKRIIQEMPDASILILAPKSLGMQIYSQLNDLGVSAELVDRYRYRELQDTMSSGNSLWPRGKVSVLSMQFAIQYDIAERISSYPWTLLVVIEAHLLAGLKESLCRRLISSSPDIRVLLVTDSGETGEKKIPNVLSQPVSFQWKSSDIVDHSGNPLFLRMPPQFEVVQFAITPAEDHIRTLVKSVIDQLKRTDSTGALLEPILLSSLASSPAAIEDRLRALRTRLLQRSGTNTSLESDDDESDDEPDDKCHTNFPLNEELLPALTTCFDLVESLPVDSKLNIFVDMLREIIQTVPGPICIVTQYRATLFYLQAQLEDMGLDSHVLHGSMSFTERSEVLHEFRQNGGILLSTYAPTEGLSLPQVEVVVFYDLPKGPHTIEQVFGRFQRIGRKVPLKVKVLSDPVMGKLFATLTDRLRWLCTEE